MYDDYDIKKLDDGRFAAYNPEIDTPLCIADTEGELIDMLALLQIAYKNGFEDGIIEERQRIRELLGL